MQERTDERRSQFSPVWFEMAALLIVVGLTYNLSESSICRGTHFMWLILLLAMASPPTAGEGDTRPPTLANA